MPRVTVVYKASKERMELVAIWDHTNPLYLWLVRACTGGRNSRYAYCIHFRLELSQRLYEVITLLKSTSLQRGDGRVGVRLVTLTWSFIAVILNQRFYCHFLAQQLGPAYLSVHKIPYIEHGGGSSLLAVS